MRFLARLQKLIHTEEGSALPFIALGIMMIVGVTGVAIDMGRLQIAQSRLQSALDATGLAIGTEISTADLSTETTKYFYANFPTNFMGTTITAGPTATPNADKTLITLNVTGNVNMTFMRIFGKTSSTITATSQVTRQSSGMELVLVIDNTGSMANSAGGGVSKISAAQTAAKTLLDTLYGKTTNTRTNLWVGVVPFSQAVNIGTDYTSWLDTAYDSTLNWGTSSWAGCVEARTNGSSTPQYDISDDPPSVQPFRQYYSTCNTDANYGTNKWYGNNATATMVWNGRRWVSSGTYNNCMRDATTQYQTTSTTTVGPNLYCPVAVQPMVAEKSTIVAKINAMTPNGNTHIDLGLAWGWRMLSPRWKKLWGGQMDANDLPNDYNKPLMNKVVILMTDGDNTLSGSNGANTATSSPGLYSAYGFPNANAMALASGECDSSGDCTAGQNEMDKRTLAACTAMKATQPKPIIIYTIALGSQVSQTGQDLLKNCATSSSYYFLSPTTNELNGIFQQIGDSLSNLYISQ